jgi:hypothetical protein
MDALQEQLNKPLVVGVASFMAGIIIGLVVLGWWLWPVQWTDAGPGDLRPEFQEVYLRMAIDSYTVHRDPIAAQQRIDEVGPTANEILAQIAANPGEQNAESIQVFQSLVEGGAVVGGTPQPTPTIETEERGPIPTLLIFFCLVTFILAAALAILYLFRDRLGGLRMPSLRREQIPAEPEFVGYEEEGVEPPIAQFMTTYNLGNDLYDDSFSIDSQAGEFLGECGVGISETVGVGEPKRVTAFEVWLFDKNDIQTVTKVLMSQHAFSDEATKQRLAAKGEPIPAEAGREMELETATLRLQARVVDMSYGSGALPPESFFDRMTLELTAWLKP